MFSGSGTNGVGGVGNGSSANDAARAVSDLEQRPTDQAQAADGEHAVSDLERVTSGRGSGRETQSELAAAGETTQRGLLKIMRDSLASLHRLISRRAQINRSIDMAIAGDGEAVNKLYKLTYEHPTACGIDEILRMEFIEVNHDTLIHVLQSLYHSSNKPTAFYSAAALSRNRLILATLLNIADESTDQTIVSDVVTFAIHVSQNRKDVDVFGSYPIGVLKRLAAKDARVTRVFANLITFIFRKELILRDLISISDEASDDNLKRAAATSIASRVNLVLNDSGRPDSLVKDIARASYTNRFMLAVLLLLAQDGNDTALQGLADAATQGATPEIRQAASMLLNALADEDPDEGGTPSTPDADGTPPPTGSSYVGDPSQMSPMRIAGDDPTMTFSISAEEFFAIYGSGGAQSVASHSPSDPAVIGGTSVPVPTTNTMLNGVIVGR